MSRHYGSHPLADTCPLCDEALGGHHPTRNPLTKWRRKWAHELCVLRERGE